MASNKTLNAKNLEALGAERLAALLIEITTGDATAKRRRTAIPADTPAALTPAFVEDGAILGGVQIVNPFKD